MEGIIDFIDGNLAKGDLIRDIQLLITKAKEEIERERFVANI